MNGPQHYAKAEICLGNAQHAEDENRERFWLASAQVHATLAQAAAIADEETTAWTEVFES